MILAQTHLCYKPGAETVVTAHELHLEIQASASAPERGLEFVLVVTIDGTDAVGYTWVFRDVHGREVWRYESSMLEDGRHNNFDAIGSLLVSLVIIPTMDILSIQMAFEKGFERESLCQLHDDMQNAFIALCGACASQ